MFNMDFPHRIKLYVILAAIAAVIGLFAGVRQGDQVAYRLNHGASIGWHSVLSLPESLYEARFDSAEQGYLVLIDPNGDAWALNKQNEWVPRPVSGELDADEYYAQFPDISCTGADLSGDLIIREPPSTAVSAVDCRIYHSPETATYIRYALLEDHTIWGWWRESHPGLVITGAGTTLTKWFRYGVQWAGWGMLAGLGAALLIEIGARIGKAIKSRRNRV